MIACAVEMDSILHHGGRLWHQGFRDCRPKTKCRWGAGRAVRFRLISGWGPVRHCRGKAAPCEIEISSKGKKRCGGGAEFGFGFGPRPRAHASLLTGRRGG